MHKNDEQTLSASIEEGFFFVCFFLKFRTAMIYFYLFFFYYFDNDGRRWIVLKTFRLRNAT